MKEMIVPSGTPGSNPNKGLSIPRCEVISDIPLGLRVLHSLRLGGRDRNTISLVGRGMSICLILLIFFPFYSQPVPYTGTFINSYMSHIY